MKDQEIKDLLQAEIDSIELRGVPPSALDNIKINSDLGIAIVIHTVRAALEKSKALT